MPQFARVCLSICLTSVVLTGTASAQHQARRDGNWWLEQSAAYRNIYMVGFFDGGTLGNSFSHWNLSVGDTCHAKIAGSYEQY